MASAQRRHQPGLAGPFGPSSAMRSPLPMNCWPVRNSSLPSGVSTAASSSLTRTLACVSRLASLMVPAERSTVRGLGRILQLLGALLQLLGLRQQQVAAGVDAEVVELRGLLAKLLDGLQVALIAPLVGRHRASSERRARPACRATKTSATAPAAGTASGWWSASRKGAVVACDHHRHLARQRVQPGFEPV